MTHAKEKIALSLCALSLLLLVGLSAFDLVGSNKKRKQVESISMGPSAVFQTESLTQLNRTASIKVAKDIVMHVIESLENNDSFDGKMLTDPNIEALNTYPEFIRQQGYIEGIKEKMPHKQVEILIKLLH